jgi:membrane-associated phospholipid phosphatase
VPSSTLSGTLAGPGPDAGLRTSPTVLAGLLAVLTVAVVEGWWPVSLDHQVADALPGRHAGGLDGLLLRSAAVLIGIATPQLTVLVTLLVTAAACWRQQSSAALRQVALPVVYLAVSVLVLKALVGRPGPPGSHPHHVLGYYPSGHTATALVCVGALARLLGQSRPRWRRRLTLVTWSWTLLVGAALVFHGYHWLSDVLAALLLGSLVLVLAGRPRATAPPAR